ncbi:MAG: SH3 domain-containing protein [Adhaeribacter sp.]
MKLSQVFFLFFFLFSQVSYAQKPSDKQLRADSLFEQQQYAASFQLYQNILDQDGQYAPQMLLKMAYIQEYFQDYTATMYYLHLYYDKTPNRAVLKKMEDLALRQNYSGYGYSDFEFFQTQFNKRYLDILQVLLSVAVFVLILMIRRRQKQRRFSRAFQVVFLVFLLFIVYYINLLDFGKKGIISRDNVAIMSAPSAGSSWIATATAGHKIDLKQERDIWYETEWNGRKAYIRKHNVIELP